MSLQPIKLTLYDKVTNGEIATFTRTYVPWRLLKSAMALKDVNPETLTDEAVDAITVLVVDTFGGQFTADQLADGADISEMMTVVYGIVARARGFSATPGNPTRPRP